MSKRDKSYVRWHVCFSSPAVFFFFFFFVVKGNFLKKPERSTCIDLIRDIYLVSRMKSVPNNLFAQVLKQNTKSQSCYS